MEKVECNGNYDNDLMAMQDSEAPSGSTQHAAPA